MKNNGVKYGLFYGVALSVVGVVAYFINPVLLFESLSWLSVSSLFLMAGLMYWAAKKTKEDRGGYLSFGEAFVPALLTSVVGNLIYMVALYVLITIDPELLVTSATATTDMLESMYRATGFSEDKVLEMTEQVESQMGSSGGVMSKSAIIAIGIINSFIMGLPFAALVAAIVKKKRPEVV